MTPDYFREIHDVLAATPGGPPDLAKVAEVMRRHGLTPAPPTSYAHPSPAWKSSRAVAKPWRRVTGS